jgi:hypothetical protein
VRSFPIGQCQRLFLALLGLSDEFGGFSQKEKKKCQRNDFNIGTEILAIVNESIDEYNRPKEATQ